MRIQRKLEAMTRRERALAYAFAQQGKQAKPDGTEQNMSWSWVERWMATRVPQSSLVENNSSKHLEPVDNKRRLVVQKGIINVGGEEKESCGSNEVSVPLESLSVRSLNEKDGYRRSRNGLKSTRSISRRKTVPSYPKNPARQARRLRGECKRHNCKQLGCQKETERNNPTSQFWLDPLTPK